MVDNLLNQQQNILESDKARWWILETLGAGTHYCLLVPYFFKLIPTSVIQ